MKYKQVLCSLFLVFLGAFFSRHYGESWDESQFYQYAVHAIESYSTWFESGEVIVTGNTYDNYGPSFVIFTSIIANWIHSLYPDWLVSDLRHFIYFLTFLAGTWAFNDIAKRWMSQTAALSSTLLFLTQPLFWGHSFISPKDIPFMSLFLISLAFGLRMADTSGVISLDSLRPSTKRSLHILTAIWLVTFIGSYAFTDSFHTLIAHLVQSAKSGDANIITHIASDLGRIDPEIYIQRYFVLFLHARSLIFFLFAVFVVFIHQRHLPSFIPALSRVILPGIILGICTSIRILGPLAGLLVLYYSIRRDGKQAASILTMYILIAIITMYITWPYLWPDPIGHFAESIKVMSQYPWKGQVLFNGKYYASNALPSSYLPVLLLIQFTEPVWLLFFVGLYALRRNNFAFIAALLWFALPLAGLIISHSPLYDNSRQIFFILPPVFLIAGLGIEIILNSINRTILQNIIVALLILPGLFAGARLHPYEYIYYNSLVKNPAGKFELDYWATSYREAMVWLNKSAPANKVVLVIGPASAAENYARIDLTVTSETDSRHKQPDYVIIVARQNYEKSLYPNARIIHTIVQDGLLLSLIKELQR